MQQQSNDPVYSKHVLEMLTVANEFCHFIEQSEDYSKKNILEFIHKILPMLYLKGILMPSVVVEDSSYNEKYVNEMQWEHVFYAIKHKLKDDDDFWMVRNTGLNEFEPQKHSLSDLLADIYQDMKDFVMLYQQSSVYAKQNAVADFKNYFQNHWGERALKASKRLHELIYQPTRDPFSDENKLGLEE